MSNYIMFLCWDDRFLAIRFLLFSFVFVIGCACFLNTLILVSVLIPDATFSTFPSASISDAALSVSRWLSCDVMALGNELTAGLSPHISRRSSKFSEKSFPLPDLDQGSTAFWYPRLSSVILILTLLYPSFICFSSILDFLLHSSISSLVKLSVWYSFMAFGRKSVGGHFSHHFSQPRVKCYHVSSQVYSLKFLFQFGFKCI